jgi:hypothetical protein
MKRHKYQYRELGSTQQTLGRLLVGLLLLVALQATAVAQSAQYSRPSWWFGVAGGGNVNFYGGSTQRLNEDWTSQVAFHEGLGLGIYAAPLIEYHRATSHWGLGLQVGYDSRRAKFAQQFSPCDCPRDLSSKLSYITAEPILRFSPFRTGLFFYAGPRVAYNVKHSFVFKQGTNPAYPEQPAIADETGDFTYIEPLLVSGQVGLGVDIPLSSQAHRVQWMLTPFVSYQPYFGQSPRSIETWTVTTVRAGFALKLGRGQSIEAPVEPLIQDEIAPVIAPEPKVAFTIHSPVNIPEARKVREVFPLRNYVFFDLGNSKIPARYVLLRKDQVKDFKEDQVELTTPVDAAGRSDRQMLVYYNILNILGDRMGKNPNTTIRLVGSSRDGAADGRLMATSIQRYLVDVFGIDERRIVVEGRDKPVLPSDQGGTLDIDLLREGDRRVTIESTSPVLLMEFHSGPDGPLRPVEVTSVQAAPLDSYVTFTNKGGEDAFTSWNLEVTDHLGTKQTFGPYTDDEISIPGKAILGTRPEGDFTVAMIGTTEAGDIVKKYSFMHMVLWTPPIDQEVMRFSVIYEFDEAQAIDIYERYLTEIVIPKIPLGAKVLIHGYTDIIGNSTYNKDLSLARANDVKHILEAGLAKAGRTDVKMQVFGFGEEPELAQFENRYPEERFYNRTVLIDIVPAGK